MFKTTFTILSTFLTLHLGLFCGYIQGESFSNLKLDPHRVPWNSLFFQAGNFLVTVSIEVELAPFPVNTVEPLLLKSPRGVPIRAPAPTAYRTAVHTTISPLFRSAVTLRNQVWFNPETAGAVQHIQLRRGEDDFEKMYRFTDQGVFRVSREPDGKQELLLAPEQWSDVKESFYPYEPDQAGCTSVCESSVIPYIISAGNQVQDSKPVDLCVFHKRLLYHVKVVPGGLQKLEVNYAEKTEQGEVLKKGTIDALRVSVQSRPLNPPVGEDEEFSFMGLKGDISIHVDRDSRIPVRISGEIPTVGRVEFKLQKMKSACGSP